ncbi:MAG: rRNA adenine methyltransferase [Spirochaetes bacterium GWF1_51_8]|nr:MAG: rRNA adenine methyltransferase [Spirochaetes bacterium GWF1_51_8]
MQFDIENKIIRLCAEGMEMEGKGDPEKAKSLFLHAWDESSTDFEKFTSAHYVARHQSSVKDKLKWDETALSYALKLADESVKEVLPSLYLNIGKCFEDMNDPENALKHYRAAESYTSYLPDDGYGNMIKMGVQNGIQRVSRTE